MRIFINSQPKAGTYFCADVIEALGFAQTHLHIMQKSCYDFSSGTKQDHLLRRTDFRSSLPADQALPRIPRGGLAVGHLFHDPGLETLMAEFRCLILTRELRSALVSGFFFAEGMMIGRYEALTDVRNGVPALVEWMARRAEAEIDAVARIFAWRRTGIPVVRYDDLRSANAPALEVIARVTGKDPDAVASAIASVRGGASTTRAAPRRRWQDYWSPEAENLFRKAGGPRLNRRLGYEPAGWADYCRDAASAVMELVRR